jgi:hypothetical protein
LKKSRVKAREILLDLLAILAIPLILLILHFFLPENLKEMLILHKSYLIGYELLTNHFIHDNLQHLKGNILYYLISICLLYFPLLALNKRKLFYTLFILNLTILPIIISLVWIPININILPQQYAQKSFGFSGIVSSFLGMAVYAWILFFNKILGINTPFAYISFILVILVSFAFIYTPNNLFLIFSTFSISLILLILTFKSINNKAEEKLVRRTRFPLIVKLLKAYIFVLYLGLYAFAFEMFPYNPTGTNIMVHYIGFVIGISTFFLLSNYLRSISE